MCIYLLIFIYLLICVKIQAIQAIRLGSRMSLNESTRLGQFLIDSKCRLTDISCGDNMVFRTIRRYNIGKSTVKCIQLCSCDLNYIEKNGKCIQILENGKVSTIFIIATFSRL